MWHTAVVIVYHMRKGLELVVVAMEEWRPLYFILFQEYKLPTHAKAFMFR